VYVASIEKTPAGTYRARWRDAGGVQRAKAFPKKADARAFLDSIAGNQPAAHVTAEAGKITVSEWADLWLDGARNLGQGGQDTYRRDLDRYILPTLGDHQIRHVTPELIDSLLTEQAKHLASSTVHRHYRTLNRMFAVAVERRRLVANPCGPVQPPRVELHEMRFLDVDQVDALAAAISDRYRAWVLVAAWGGPRWSECVGLRRSSVDGARVSIVEQLKRRADGEWHRDRPKTKAGRRVVTLPAFVADELAAHLDTFAGPGPDGLVFPNRAGNPTIASSFTQATFKPALKRAGLDTAVRIHDLRHTAVALAIKAGAHPKAIQARMGHASIMVTLDRYGHLFPDTDEQIAAALDGLRTSSGVARPPGDARG
jgi:integrase